MAKQNSRDSGIRSGQEFFSLPLLLWVSPGLYILHLPNEQVNAKWPRDPPSTQDGKPGGQPYLGPHPAPGACSAWDSTEHMGWVIE